MTQPFGFFVFLNLSLIVDLLQVPLQLRLIVFSSAVLLHLCVMVFLDVADDLLLWQHAEGAGDPIVSSAGVGHQRLHQVAKLVCTHGTFIEITWSSVYSHVKILLQNLPSVP